MGGKFNRDLAGKLNRDFVVFLTDVCIRPENIKIRSYSDDRTEDEIVCQFHNEDYYGTHMIYHLLYPDTATKIKMMAFTNKEGQYQQGEKVLMSIDPNKIHVFKGGE